MAKTPRSWWWRDVAVLVLAAGAVGIAAAQEMEVQFTGTLTSVGGVAGASAGDAVSGTLAIDLAALLPTTMTNGSTFSTAVLSTPAADPSPSRSTLALSSGFAFSTGLAGFNHIADLGLYRNAATGYNFYDLSSTDLDVLPGVEAFSVGLRVWDLLGSGTAIFATPPGDLSLLQSVDWFAPGATTSGTFEAGDGGGAFEITSLHVGPVAAVPEPATLPILLGGLGLVGVVARRRRARSP